MKNITVKFYNADNLGDDLFVKILANRYLDTFKVRRRMQGTTIDGIPNVVSVGSKFANRLYLLAERVLSRSNLALRQLIRRSDALVYIGGSVFIEGDSLEHWRREAVFYRNLSIPYYILGSNIGPFGSPEFLGIVKDILIEAKDVCLRDKSSYELVKGIPTTRLATDIAFALDASPYEIRKEKLAVFSLIDGYRKFNKGTARKYEAEICTMTKHLVDRGYRIVYMSFCEYEGDEVANKRIFEALSGQAKKHVELFNYRGNLDEALALIASSEIIIASRFHAVILGLLFSKKVLPMAYSDKTTNILSDMNFKGPVVDIRKINDFSGKDFDFSSLKINNVDAQIKLAEKQFQELDKVLEKRA